MTTTMTWELYESMRPCRSGGQTVRTKAMKSILFRNAGAKSKHGVWDEDYPPQTILALHVSTSVVGLDVPPEEGNETREAEQ